MSVLLMRRRHVEGPVDSGLLALYLLDEGAGQLLNDTSSSLQNATLGSTVGPDTNDPSWSATGLTFTVDDFVQSDAAEMRPDGWTVCTAVRPTPASVAPIVGWGGTSFPAVYGAAPFNGNRPLIWLASNCFRYFETADPVDVQDGEWHFMVFRCPGNSSGDIQASSLLVDGQEQGVNSTTASTAGNAKTVFRIGTAGALYFAEMEMAFFSLHSRMLSGTESESMRTFAKSQLQGRVALP